MVQLLCSACYILRRHIQFLYPLLTNNMSNIHHQQFSPFTKIRNILLVLRWSCGFPMSSKNDAFTQFSFNPFLECARYLLYIFFMSLPSAYIYHIFTKVTGIDSPILAFIVMVEGAGMSTLDLVVMMTLPFVSGLFNLLYLSAFRKNHEGINKISGYLAHLNKQFHDASKYPNLTSYQSRRKQYYLPFFLLWLVTAFANASYVGAFFLILDNETYKHRLSEVEKIIFCVLYMLYNFSMIYPPMAVSSDFVTCCLLTETKHSFDQFKEILKLRSKLPTNGKDKKRSDNSYQIDKESTVFVRSVL